MTEAQSKRFTLDAVVREWLTEPYAGGFYLTMARQDNRQLWDIAIRNALEEVRGSRTCTRLPAQLLRPLSPRQSAPSRIGNY